METGGEGGEGGARGAQSGGRGVAGGVLGGEVMTLGKALGDVPRVLPGSELTNFPPHSPGPKLLWPTILRSRKQTNLWQD